MSALNLPKTERIDVRATGAVKQLLQEAARSCHKNVSEFLLDAGVTAANHALADRRALRAGVFARQRQDVHHRNAGDVRYALGRKLRRARLQLVEAQRVFLDEVVVVQVLADDHVHHAQRQRGGKPKNSTESTSRGNGRASNHRHRKRQSCIHH